MDALSETLRVVRLDGAIFFNARYTAPWCYHSCNADSVAPQLAPGAEKVVIFHMITEGECYAQLDGQAPVKLVAGDVVLFPRGEAHLMMSEPGVPVGATGRLSAMLARRPRQLTYGGGGAPTRFMCGYLAGEAKLAQMLMAGLPSVVKVNVRDSAAGAWLESSVHYALAEAHSPRAGGSGLLSKLAEVLFLEVLRLYMNEEGAEGRTGWLAGVRDRVVGAALSAMHRDPARSWTLEVLARSVGASRSVLAERFQRLVGTSPMLYLTQWRMMLAAGMLRNSNAQLTHIAQDVGYQTDTAFIRAFRREYGQPPATWRRQNCRANDEEQPLRLAS